jgi:hypothetical protein
VRSALLVAALGAAAVGCAQPTEPAQCDGIVEVGCDGGLPGASRDDASGTWESSPWSGPHFSYARYTTYRVCHGLGRVPASVEVWAAFAPSGGSVAKQIGSAAVVIPSCGNDAGVTDRSVLIRNGGGQDFFVRVVLRP